MRKTLLSLALLAGPAFADSQAIAPGAPLAPGQIGHVFDAACIASQPTMIEDRAAILAEVFAFEPTDLGTDAGWLSADGAISVTVDGNPLKTTCEMSIVADLGGDGADLYDGLETHLPEEAAETEAEYVDGGLVWSWSKSGVSYSLTYTEVEGAFLISYEASR